MVKKKTTKTKSTKAKKPKSKSTTKKSSTATKSKKKVVSSSSSGAPMLERLVKKAGSRYYSPSSISVPERMLKRFVVRGLAQEKDGKFKATQEGKDALRKVDEK